MPRLQLEGPETGPKTGLEIGRIEDGCQAESWVVKRASIFNNHFDSAVSAPSLFGVIRGYGRLRPQPSRGDSARADPVPLQRPGYALGPPLREFLVVGLLLGTLPARVPLDRNPSPGRLVLQDRSDLADAVASFRSELGAVELEVDAGKVHGHAAVGFPRLDITPFEFLDDGLVFSYLASLFFNAPLLFLLFLLLAL